MGGFEMPATNRAARSIGNLQPVSLNDSPTFLRKPFGFLLSLIFLLALVSGTTLAQGKEEKQPKKPVAQPTTTEESIEALFGPDEEKPKSDDPASQRVDPKNNEPIMFIADTDNGRVVIMQGIKGVGYTSVGLPGYGFGRFLRPRQVWVDHLKRLYVADSGNNRIVRMDQREDGGWGEMGGFSSPTGVATDKNGIYIADTKADRVVLVEELKDGQEFKEVLTHRQLSRPTSLWLDAEGALYICSGEDPPGGKVFKTWIEKDRRRWKMFEGEGLQGSRFRPSMIVTTRNRTKFIDGSGQRLVDMKDLSGKRIREMRFREERRWRLSRPQGLAVDESGRRFFIADSGNDRVLEIKGDGTVVGEFRGHNADPTSALRNPTSIFIYSPAPEPEPEEDEEDEDS